MIKNLVKDNMCVFWSKMIENIKKTRAIKSNKFFRKNDQVSFEKVIPQISFLSMSNIEVSRGHKKTIEKTIWVELYYLLIRLF